ncbi:MAG: acyl-CoA/acyl-ACP dehydrogenase [Spirochaetaceae bacterium]|nr:acyl-CoA/acyl-ACP dehydrogenase [Spirochaetaceae bacterium]
MPRELADFNLDEERVAFRDTLRRFVEEALPMTAVRGVIDSGVAFERDVWTRACDELGLAGIAIDEADGGQGFGAKELAIALGELGRGLAPLPLLASAGLAARVVAAVLGRGKAGEWLGPVAAGEIATLAWLEAGGDWDPAATALEVEGQGAGVRLRGEKHFVLDAPQAERIFVVARAPGSHCDEGLGLFAVEREAAGLSIHAQEGLDPTRSLARVVFDGAPARPVGEAGAAGPGIRRGLEEASALLAAEMVGGFQQVLETAVAYAAERHQFSRPIGSFQAIKHKCADMLIGFEGARTASDAAIVAIDEDDPDRAELAMVAKAHVGPAYVRAAIENMQIHGGVGYTWEYDAHLYYRRAVSSGALLGDATFHQDALVRRIAARRASTTTGATPAQGGRR